MLPQQERLAFAVCLAVLVSESVSPVVRREYWNSVEVRSSKAAQARNGAVVAAVVAAAAADPWGVVVHRTGSVHYDGSCHPGRGAAAGCCDASLATFFNEDTRLSEHASLSMQSMMDSRG